MLTQSENFLFKKKEKIEVVAPGITRQLLGYNDQILMARVTFEEGSEGYVHDHFHSQVTYIESGEFEVNIDGEKKLMVGGDGFYIPPNAKHGAICRKAGVLIDVFSPVRADFIKDNSL
ncbi:cupin domain-containing protein [Agarilytica rhodophyticola]|uniref:cupin domain-containing protein n=1 Tax=Agarilytica rhodophyticola TaxID=1737490 RepID=UPI000B34621E|nr:cupin domain-containing protein [Agarilytica rhodophyticola]